MLGPSCCSNFLSTLTLYLEEWYIHNFLSLENYTGVSKENHNYKETANSKFWESLYRFSPAFRNEFPTDSSKSKFEEFSDLRKKKLELIDEINDNNNTLREIKSAQKLDKDLPESAKEKNRHYLELKQEYSTFFDEDSGNSSIKEGLKEIEEYIKSEKESLKSNLSKINENIKNITSESNINDKESSNNSKRNMDESDADVDVQPSSKKVSHSNDKDTNSPYSSQSDNSPSQSDKGPSQNEQNPPQDKQNSQSDQPCSENDRGSSFWDFF